MAESSLPLGVHVFGSTPMNATTIRAAYRLENGNLNVQDLRANLLGGSLTGSYQMLHMAANPASRVSAALKGVQLETASRVFLPRSQQPLVAGEMNLSASAAWTASVSDGSVHAVLLILLRRQRAGRESRAFR